MTISLVYTLPAASCLTLLRQLLADTYLTVIAEHSFFDSLKYSSSPTVRAILSYYPKTMNNA